MRYLHPLKKLANIFTRAMIKRFRQKPARPSAPFMRAGRRGQRGFSLPEVIVTMIIASLIISLAFGAFFSISQMINRMEVESERRVDLSRAFDFLTAEIRSSQRVNATAAAATTPLASIITGVGLSGIVSGTPVLYLEVPFSSPPTTSCPAGGLSYDRVVYDIRPNPNHWLGPRVITRYGRVPTAEGRIDPCRDPIANDVLVDNMTDNNPSPLPPCPAPGVQTGSGGFYACVTNGLVRLSLQSKVVNLKTQDIDSNALSRPGLYALKPVLTGVSGSGQMSLSWTWPGTTGVNFKVYRVDGSDRIELPDANLTDLAASDPSPRPGVQNCYTVVATSGGYNSEESNTVCANF
jgi:prepilin-type N-terminal cleavage/methylation domain-containing protein